MVVPPFGAGDIVAVGTLAWNVYKSCKDAPDSFKDISNEVLSLHAVLKEADETIFKSPLPPQSQARLKTIYEGCQSVLSDLQALVDKYENLGTQSKWTWDRMKWGTENVAEIRSRLVSNTTFLTAYIRWESSIFKHLESQLMESLYSTSQTRVEQKLDKFISDIQQGKRAPSVISLQTVDELNPDDEETWRTIHKELEDIGISVAVFEANKDFIFQWISSALDTGAFQEKAGPSPPGSTLSLDPQSSTSSLSRWVRESKKKAVVSDTEPPQASKAKTKPTGNYTIMQAEQASNEIVAAGGPHAPAIPTKVPRFAAFLAALSQPKGRLEDALLASDLDRARKILKDPATSRLIDKQTLNNALDLAIRDPKNGAFTLPADAGADISDGRLYHYYLTTAVERRRRRDIVAFLLDRGADVNYQSVKGESLLTIAVNHRHRDLTEYLLDRGADVNYQSGDGTAYSSALRAAITKADEAMITLLSQRGADLNAVQSNGYPTAIHQASAQDHVDIVDLLLNLGADFNSPQRGFGTPLMFSIYSGCFSNAELLIKRRANINKVDVPLSDQFSSRLFYSAIYVAIYVSSPYLVSLLLHNGVGTNSHKAYEFAGDYCNKRPEMSFPWDERQTSKILSDAELVVRLLKSAAQV